MHYLFGFSGRINRAKMWLFILVTLAWEIVVGLIAALGLRWTELSEHTSSWSNSDPSGGMAVGAALGFPCPSITGPVDWAVIAVLAVLVLAYFVALFAVYTKRLHDRNKGAWWLLLFLVIPFGNSVLQIAAMPSLLAMGSYFGPLGMGLGGAHLISTILIIWAFIELFCLRGTTGDNRFGPDPLAR